MESCCGSSENQGQPSGPYLRLDTPDSYPGRGAAVFRNSYRTCPVGWGFSGEGVWGLKLACAASWWSLSGLSDPGGQVADQALRVAHTCPHPRKLG